MQKCRLVTRFGCVMAAMTSPSSRHKSTTKHEPINLHFSSPQSSNLLHPSLTSLAIFQKQRNLEPHRHIAIMTLNTVLSTILLQLCLAPLGLAAPVSTEALDNSWQYGTGGGLLGLVVLILDIIVFGEPPRPRRNPETQILISRS
jgi:hypothetical protein